MNNLVSIIIPVYNASKTLDKCLQSLRLQTYLNVEYIFVNDCSIDNSEDMICNFAFEMKSKNIVVKIVSHEVNCGVAKARNTGLDNAKGDYIYFIDSDDYLDSEAIETMVKLASNSSLDILGIEWKLCFTNNERYMKQANFYTQKEAIDNLMYGIMRWNLWLFLVKRSLYENNNIRFIPGDNMGEDMMVMIKLFTFAKNVSLLKKPYYHYRLINADAVSREMSKNNIKQVTSNVNNLELFAKYENNEQIIKLLPFLKLNIKLPLLMSNKKSNYLTWYNWFPESNSFCMKNKLLPFRTRFLQFCASKKIFFVLRLYNIFVQKFIYGIIFK